MSKNQKTQSSREQLVEAVNDYLDELMRYKVAERQRNEASERVSEAGRKLESVYFDGVVESTGKIIVKNHDGDPILIELGRAGRVYPKVIKIETYIEL